MAYEPGKSTIDQLMYLAFTTSCVCVLQRLSKLDQALLQGFLGASWRRLGSHIVESVSFRSERLCIWRNLPFYVTALLYTQVERVVVNRWK